LIFYRNQPSPTGETSFLFLTREQLKLPTQKSEQDLTEIKWLETRPKREEAELSDKLTTTFPTGKKNVYASIGKPSNFFHE
jgi:hypothetical protein